MPWSENFFFVVFTSIKEFNYDYYILRRKLLRIQKSTTTTTKLKLLIFIQKHAHVTKSTIKFCNTSGLILI